MKGEIDGRYTTLRKRRRWEWMAVATAASAAAATSARAQQTTIVLHGNYLSGGVDDLSADLGGDGVADFNIRNTFHVSHPTAGLRSFAAGVTAADQNLQAFWRTDAGGTHRQAVVSVIGIRESSNKFGVDAGNPEESETENIFISFRGDPAINGGALTSGTLEVTGIASITNTEIEFDSFTYLENAAAIPEASSLALLAIGATGVIALRQRRKAA
jgi:hypothetical protein